MTRLLGAGFLDSFRLVNGDVTGAYSWWSYMAQSYGAVYIHFGGSVPAYEAIAARSELLEIDGIGGGWKGALFDRDPGRKAQLGSEHSVYTTGARLLEGLPKLGRELTQTGNPSAFTFADTSSAASGESGVRVQFSYSENHRPWFAYDAASGEYLRFEYGKPQIDGLTGDQIAVKNVLLLRMLREGFENRWIDVYENEGKRSGAYSSGARPHPYVLLNQKDTLDSMTVPFRDKKTGTAVPVSLAYFFLPLPALATPSFRALPALNTG